MLIIAGQKLCGRVDQVPGKCYVKTRFFHLYYVPLIPLSSWVIEQGTEKPSGFRGKQIPICLKSVIFGWLQTGLVIFGSYEAIIGARLILDHRQAPNNDLTGEVKLLIGSMCLIAWMLFTFWPYPANEARAKDLTGRLGLKYETTPDHFYGDQ